VKFAVDPKFPYGRYLYGGHERDDSRAAKAMSNELKAATRIFRYFFELQSKTAQG